MRQNAKRRRFTHSLGLSSGELENPPCPLAPCNRITNILIILVPTSADSLLEWLKDTSFKPLPSQRNSIQTTLTVCSIQANQSPKYDSWAAYLRHKFWFWSEYVTWKEYHKVSWSTSVSIQTLYPPTFSSCKYISGSQGLKSYPTRETSYMFVLCA